MPAINLSLLTTFWNSAKNYILTHFLKKPHFLGYVVGQTTITLSEDVRTFSKLIFVLKTNDGIYFEMSFKGGSGVLFGYGASVNTNTTTPGSWFKLIRLNITNDGKTITIPNSGTNEIAFKTSSADVANANTTIRDIWGIP